MFPFEQLGRAAQALVNEAEKVGTALVKTAQDAVKWAGDVVQGDVGTQAVPIPEVVVEVMNGESSSWDNSGDTAYIASNSHSQISASLSAMLNNLEPAWTGKASEGARERTKIFSRAIDLAGESFNHNGNNVSDAANGFNQAKDSMEPMGEPPDRTFLDVFLPWDTDTEKAIDRYNKTAEANKNIYDRYAAHLDGQGAGLRTDYGEISPEFGQPSAGESVPVRGFGARGDSGEDHPVRSGGQPVMPMVGGGSPPSGPVAGPGGHTGSGPVSDPGSVQVPAVGGRHVGGDGTSVAGYHPLESRTGPQPPHLSAPVVPGPGGGSGSMPGGGNLVSGPGGLGAAGRPGGVGRLGESGGAPGGGRQTGARGIVDEPGRGSAASGRGGGGRLAGAPAGIAPGAGRGAKEEETEHRRKYIQDEDTLFTDEDKMQVDPTTGLPPAPPTIGA